MSSSSSSCSSLSQRELLISQGRPAPSPLYRGTAASRGDTVYCCSMGSDLVHEYSTSTSEWRTLSPCPVAGFALAMVDGSLCLVGGEVRSEREPVPVAHLHVYVDGDKSWCRDRYPPMPTKRSYSAAVGYGVSLIVAGGHTTYVRSYHTLTTVDILDTSTFKWGRAAPLPWPVRSPSLAVQNSLLYLTGGWDDSVTRILKTDIKLLVSTSVPHGSKPRSRKLGESVSVVWEILEERAPVCNGSCGVLDGHLLMIGGREGERGRVCGRVWECEEGEGWKEVGVLPGAAALCHSLCASVTSGGVLLVIGGLEKGGMATRRVWQLQFSTSPTAN